MKTGREQGKGLFAFVEVSDGSCSANLQVIVDAAVADLGQLVPTGTSVSVEGLLQIPPEGTKQKIELRVEKVLDVGTVDPAKYPIPKTKLTLEFLRDRIHFRPRTNAVCVASLFLCYFRINVLNFCFSFSIFSTAICMFLDSCSCENPKCTCLCNSYVLSRSWVSLYTYSNYHHQ